MCQLLNETKKMRKVLKHFISAGCVLFQILDVNSVPKFIFKEFKSNLSMLKVYVCVKNDPSRITLLINVNSFIIILGYIYQLSTFHHISMMKPNYCNQNNSASFIHIQEAR